VIDTLPGLALQPVLGPLAPPVPAPAAGGDSGQSGLILPPARCGRWHRHDLGGGYELRAHGKAIVLVAPAGAGWHVHNIDASCTARLAEAAAADRLAARIARLATA
jgi:hypothetical protein